MAITYLESLLNVFKNEIVPIDFSVQQRINRHIRDIFYASCVLTELYETDLSFTLSNILKGIDRGSNQKIDATGLPMTGPARDYIKQKYDLYVSQGYNNADAVRMSYLDMVLYWFYHSPTVKEILEGGV